MISDFFYPNMGGVENHLFNLSQCLILRGHKVPADRRYPLAELTERYRGLKVYYLPIPVLYMQCSLPTILCNLPFLRSIYLRERINHVHGHQAFSNLCHEGIFHARTMGIPCTFTDHSLFGFADTSSILTNKLLKFTLSDAENVICVSHTSKENTVLRAALDPRKVFTIPNAVISECFKPDPSRADPRYVTIVVLSRLVYRKGIDLLVPIIPRICQAFPYVHFLVAGDGPKKVDLEQMRDEHLLHNRVRLMGSVASEEAASVMVQGNIFLNTSLTEAFCMAIVEAASCGLLVVSTRVGGVPEVLPASMLRLAAPDEDHLFSTLSEAIKNIREGRIDTSSFHAQVSQMYSWLDVAERTEAVYLRNEAYSRDHSLLHRLSEYYGCEWIVPAQSIDIAPDLIYQNDPESYEHRLKQAYKEQELWRLQCGQELASEK